MQQKEWRGGNMTAASDTAPERETPHVTALWRYPVKGLSGEALSVADLTAGQSIAFDRAWAIENGPGKFDAMAPKHLPKIAFLMLMRDEKLATLESSFDEDTRTLRVMRDGKQVAAGALDQPVGRRMLEQFFAAYMTDALRGAPKIVSAKGHVFSDMATPALHIINRATVDDVAARIGQPLDLRRFRANVIVEGMPAWQEFDWIDRDISIGSATLRGFCRTERCDATNVNPETAVRDLSLPRQLERIYGHTDVGIYATVKASGLIAVGDTIAVTTSA